MVRVSATRSSRLMKFLGSLLILIGMAIVLLSFSMDRLGVGGPPGYGYREFGTALIGGLALFSGGICLSSTCRHLLSLLVFRRTRLAQIIVFSFPLALTLGAVLIYLVSPLDYHFLSDEDGYVENATAIVYFFAFFAALCVGKRLRPDRRLVAVMYYGLAVGLLFIAMEEISWGQRLLNFQTPEFVKQRNMQSEFNLHNLRGFQTNPNDKGLFSSLTVKLLLLVSIYGAFLWFVIPRAIKSRHEIVVRLLAPTPLLLFYFLPSVIIHVIFLWIPQGIGSYVPRNSEAEIAELILSFGFLMFVLGNLGLYPANHESDRLT